MRKLSGLILCLLASSAQASPPLSEESLITRAIINLDDSRIPRLKLLQQFQQILAQYPNSRRAKHYCVLLSQMVIEDAAHEKAAKPISAMTEGEKVKEFLFRLRDQEGDQPMEYFLCDPIAYSQTKDTPAHELVKLGLVAVPSLIETLHDQRPTRAVGQRRDEYYVLTVGDCAESVLSQIAGRTFFLPTTTTSTMTGDGKTDAAEKSARAWWQEVQQKGERQVLLEGVVAASDDSPEQAKLLMKLDSRAAVAAVDVALSRLAKAQLEKAFVYALVADPSPETNALLLKIVKQAKSVEAKEAASKELIKRETGR